jgi:pimeloyl-ACP methyl ester carboxylesterase
MKERAGTVGRTGLDEVLRGIRLRRPDIKLHLIGHSFGGRLVTAAAVGPDNQPALPIDTLTLLQAAFSHYGFADNYEGNKDGFFRVLVTEHRVKGPVLISCTVNDKAVGLAYPIASLVARQVASRLGDKNDKYGGIGSNGAQKTPEATDSHLLPVGGAYQFEAGKLHNLTSDEFIKGHSDICKNEVAYAVLTAVAMT